MKNNLKSEILVPAGIVLAFTVLSLVGLTGAIDDKLFDAFLHLRPQTPIDPRTVVVAVDDGFINAVGTYPIPRKVTADGLMLLAEMGARQAVFDIEYLNKSPRGVNAEVLEKQVPAVVEGEIGGLQDRIRQLFGALIRGQTSAGEAGGFVKDLVASAEGGKQAILDEVGRVALDNDLYLSQAIRFFGNCYLTIHRLDAQDPAVPEGLRQAVRDRFALANLEAGSGPVYRVADISPVIPPMLDQARGLGFTNVEVDSDGVRRRVELVARYQDSYLAQLAFRPVLDLLGNPKVILESGGIVLKDAVYPDGAKRTVRIPYATDGRVLLDWPHGKLGESFSQVSFEALLIHEQLWNDLVSNLRDRDSWNYFMPYQESKPDAVPLLEQERQSRALREAIMSGQEKPELVAAYRQLRDRFLGELGAYLDSRPEDTITAMVDQALAAPKLSAEDRAQFAQIKADAPVFFAKTRGIHERLIRLRGVEFKPLAGAFCIIGETATGSTDLGANPFQNSYPNVGTHATLVNMVLQDRFIFDLSPWWSALLAMAAAIGISVLTRPMKPARAIIVGLSASSLVVVLVWLLFLATGMYLPVFPVAASLVLSFVSVTFIKFLITEKEKGFLRNAFSHYLSADVIKEIVANPEMLRLGGQQKYMTAMFTDIKGFSTISEKMTPTELVNLLNQYLTAMSDVILDLKGTIDKYEGDAIIAFFGAPLDLEDHAARACLAAIRMRRLESQINERFLAEGLAPSRLLTRFGINSGDMVVGNMGTSRKMDYTIIGDSVNLAARLEGVNKQYGTWICVSEETVNQVGSQVVARKLDRIRVVGKSVPIRIYELIEEPDHLDAGLAEMLAAFHEGLELFEAKDWKGAVLRFAAAQKLAPEDGPTLRYLKKCKEFITTPPADTWDGVFTLDMK